MASAMKGKRNLDKAEKAYQLIKDKLEHPWTNMNPFKLNESMKKSLSDYEAMSKNFFEGKLPLNPNFPFSIINKHIQKLKAGTDLVDMFRLSYIFPSKVDTDTKEYLDIMKNELEGDECRDYAVNRTIRRAKIFLKSLVNLANECTNGWQSFDSEQQIIKKSRLFLVGKPGIGKTTFINYLISVHAHDLALKKNSMIIRVDLNDAINKTADFRTLIEKKFYKVYRSYFYDKEIFMPDFAELKNYIINKRKLNLVNIKHLNTTSIDQSIDDFIKERPLLDYAFISDLMHYLNDKKSISFIFIIDGLDYITLDEIHNELFLEWLEQLNSYILTRDAYKGCYLITMRDVSFQRALKYKTPSTQGTWHSPKKISIEQCDFKDMILKKLKLAEREILANIHRFRDKQLPQYKVFAWITPEIVNNISLEYLAYISMPFVDNLEEVLSTVYNYADLEKKIIDVGIRKLQAITCGNYRCIMRNLNYLLGYFYYSYGKDEDIVESKFKSSLQDRLRRLYGRSFLVLRTFIVGMMENKEYRTPYSYYLDTNNGNSIVFSKTGQRFVIPPVNVFVYSDSESSPNQYRGLFKIRLLQFLTFYKENINIFVLLKCFNNHFGYINNNVLKADIEEMIYSQLITVTDMGAYLKNQNCNIKITELGKFVLTNMIYRYVYYETMLDSLPMPETVANAIEPLNYYWETCNDLNLYAVTKSRSVMTYLSFLRYVEEKEKTNFNELQYQLPEDKRVEFKTYFSSIIPKIEKSIRNEIVGLYTDRLNKDELNFKQILKKNYGIKI